MAKRFNPEFKQQEIDDALTKLHESLAAIAQKLGVGYGTLDKWICEANPKGSSKRQLFLNIVTGFLKREATLSPKRFST
jgi:transposase